MNVADVTPVSPDAAKVRVCVVGEIRPTNVAAENVATPDDVLTDVVPPIVPGDPVTVTLVAGCVVTALPPESTTVTAGDPGITPPDVPPDDGCVDTFSAAPVPTERVKLLLVDAPKPGAENVSVYVPIGPLIERFANVATPDESVVAVIVPPKTAAFCRPEGVGTVPSAAVTVTPETGLRSDSVTAGCVESATPTWPEEGCLVTWLSPTTNGAEAVESLEPESRALNALTVNVYVLPAESDETVHEAVGAVNDEATRVLVHVRVVPPSELVAVTV